MKTNQTAEVINDVRQEFKRRLPDEISKQVDREMEHYRPIIHESLESLRLSGAVEKWIPSLVEEKLKQAIAAELAAQLSKSEVPAP